MDLRDNLEKVTDMLVKAGKREELLLLENRELQLKNGIATEDVRLAREARTNWKHQAWNSAAAAHELRKWLKRCLEELAAMQGYDDAVKASNLTPTQAEEEIAALKNLAMRVKECVNNPVLSVLQLIINAHVALEATKKEGA